RPLDLDPADGSLGETLAQQRADLEIRVQVLGEVLRIGEPAGVPLPRDAEPNANRMYFLTHVYVPCYSSATWMVMWLLRLMMRLPRPLARARNRFRVGASSTMIAATLSSSISAP